MNPPSHLNWWPFRAVGQVSQEQGDDPMTGPDPHVVAVVAVVASCLSWPSCSSCSS